ncbi:MAG: hypothetical protein LBK64_04340, partial [Spirochaetaceae bacterium]|nr:hypothetical protein [Spirochaetaceae bacterium]
MKHMCFVMVIAACLAASGFAQNRDGPGSPDNAARRNRRETRREHRVPETLALSGPLEVLDGRIVLKQGDTVYYVMGIQGLIGFVDGLREGERVELEGYVFPPGIQAGVPAAETGTEARRVYRVTKLTVNQKTYEIPIGTAFAGRRPGNSGPQPFGR